MLTGQRPHLTVNPLPHAKLIVVEPSSNGRPEGEIVVDDREYRRLDEAQSRNRKVRIRRVLIVNILQALKYLFSATERYPHRRLTQRSDVSASHVGLIQRTKKPPGKEH